MPEHTYDGPGPMTYPSSRDSAGTHIGTVQPGEIRDLDEPLDHWWRETTDEDRARQAAIQAGQDGTQAAEPETSGTPSPQPPAPVPAPPAVVPQPPAPPAPAATQEG